MVRFWCLVRAHLRVHRWPSPSHASSHGGRVREVSFIRTLISFRGLVNDPHDQITPMTQLPPKGPTSKYNIKDYVSIYEFCEVQSVFNRNYAHCSAVLPLGICLTEIIKTNHLLWSYWNFRDPHLHGPQRTLILYKLKYPQNLDLPVTCKVCIKAYIYAKFVSRHWPDIF